MDHLSVISEYQWRFVNFGESLETCQILVEICQHLLILLNFRENLLTITRRCTNIHYTFRFRNLVKTTLLSEFLDLPGF